MQHISGFICDTRPDRGAHLGAVARHVLLERLLLETDAPFITPRNMPRRLSAGGRCEPFHIGNI
jgi:TatD DNase family protein